MNSQRQQEREGVVGEHDQIHAGEKGREERQHPLRLGLVPAVAEAVEARRGAAEVDDDEKERRQRVEPEMRAEPRQAERQDQRSPLAPPRSSTKARTSKAAEIASVPP